MREGLDEGVRVGECGGANEWVGDWSLLCGDLYITY